MRPWQREFGSAHLTGATLPYDKLVLSPGIDFKWGAIAGYDEKASEAMPQDVLRSLFEAAHWAPSAFNGQPWRFVYAHRGTPDRR